MVDTNPENIKKFAESLDKMSSEILTDTLRELKKLPPEKQEQALIEFQKLYPNGFEAIFGNMKD